MRRMLTSPIGCAVPGWQPPSKAAASQQKRSPGISIFSVHSLPFARGFHAFDRAFFDDVEVFGRIAFAEDEVVLPITGF